ncbi:MAG: glycosyltransferase [Myxococcaceae bacterium]|nr:glycosyltransferase [Myxococcaceae bacterium]
MAWRCFALSTQAVIAGTIMSRHSVGAEHASLVSFDIAPSPRMATEQLLLALSDWQQECERSGDRSDAAVLRQSLVANLLTQGGALQGLSGALELAERYADVVAPPSEARGPGAALRELFFPLEVEFLRPQAEFNRAFVEVARRVLSSPSATIRSWTRARLKPLADPHGFRVKSHRNNVVGRLVELLKKSSLVALEPFAKGFLDRQAEWNDWAMALLERFGVGGVEPIELQAILDRMAEGPHPSDQPPASVTENVLAFWKELERKQLLFNRQVVTLFRGKVGLPSSQVRYDDWIRTIEKQRLAEPAPAVALTVGALIDGRGASAAALRQTVESLEKQVVPPTEIIVVENGEARLPAAELVLLLRAGDVVASDATRCFARAAIENPEASWFYADEDRDVSHKRVEPLLKARFNPALLFSCDLFARSCAARRTLLERLPLPSPEVPFRYDLALRAHEAHASFAHVPSVLVTSPGPSRPGDLVPEHGERSLARFFERQGVAVEIDRRHTAFQVRFVPPRRPLVSIIVPFKDKPELLRQLLKSLSATSYENYELLLVSNQSSEPETEALLSSITDRRVRVSKWDHPFSYTAINNDAARQAKGELLLFLNNDIEISETRWLTDLVGRALQPGTGVVGARLLFPDRTLQHVGVVVGMSGYADHVMSGQPDDGGLTVAGSSDWSREWSAVTSACMLISREDYDAVGGFDERFKLCGGDVDLCLRVRARGKRIVYAAEVTLIHHESATRGRSVIPQSDFVESLRAYRGVLGADPFYPSALSLATTTPQLRTPDEPTAIELSVRALGFVAGDRASPLSSARVASINSVRRFINELDDAPPVSRSTLSRPPRDITWLIPGFAHPFGGIHTIFRFAHLWKKHFDVTNRFVVYDQPNVSAREIEARAAMLWPELPGSFEVLGSLSAVGSLPQTDLAIATLWSSAFLVARHPRAGARAYFVQDDEPAFHAAGSLSALADRTYELGLYGIFNSRGLHDTLTTRHSIRGTFFEPSVDHDLFHANGRVSQHDPLRVFFYARPSVDRNAFELGLESLREFKARLDGPVEIVCAGEFFDPALFGASGLIENLGVLPYAETAALYRSSHLGLCFMMTKHPSYLPLELMACGATVVTNVNPANDWLFEDGANCLLSRPTRAGVVESLLRAARDPELRQRIGSGAAERLRRTTWERQATRTFDHLTRALTASNPT